METNRCSLLAGWNGAPASLHKITEGESGVIRIPQCHSKIIFHILRKRLWDKIGWSSRLREMFLDFQQIKAIQGTTCEINVHPKLDGVSPHPPGRGAPAQDYQRFNRENAGALRARRRQILFPRPSPRRGGRLLLLPQWRCPGRLGARRSGRRASTDRYGDRRLRR